jgi:tripartite-type tricarboxylate transporter receptor subunit TctC
VSVAVRAGGLALVAAVTAALSAPPARAQSVAEFYAGRQVKFVIGTAGGGGYEFYGRLVSRFLTKHMPGHPTFVIQDMPGAAGIVAANYLYNIARQDGSEIGMMGRATGTQPLIDPKDKGPRYDARRFNWIGTPQQEVGLVLVRTSSPVRSLQDLKQHELIVSGTTAAAPPSYYPRLMNKLIGTRFKVVDGYKGSQEALLAVERGEVEGHCSGSSSALLRNRIEPWIADGRLRIVAQIGLERDPDLPDVPLILDLAASAAERQILELVLTQQVMAWPVVAPPGVPAERVAALRQAFDAAMQDHEMLAEAAKQKLIINPVSGGRIHELLARVYATPQDLLDRLAALSERN